VVSTCFKPPFSKPGLDACVNEGQKRNIVLVGHDVQSDIRFLKSDGYDVRTLSTLIDMADTSLMWRSFKKESNPRNLATILSELGIIAWNLHNGGNDAVYTLQAMIGIAIRSLTDPNQTHNREEGKYNYVAE
jgi:DNA polymerase III epsilon subunit-like protein